MVVKMRHKKQETVFVGMSGGVDSSVTAYLLKKQGYAVVGVFMRCYNVDGCAEQDAQDARRVAEKIGIPFYVWDFEEEYKRAVVDYMAQGYRKGITPNPDVMCNKEIKFGLFLNRAIATGADYVATGHYVRLAKTKSGEYELHQAVDDLKDQSYFLWTLTQKQLAHCLFPVGKYKKTDIRKIAGEAKLPTANKKDSQGVCFLGKISVSDFLIEKKYIAEKKGAVIFEKSGNIIGYHRGVQFYTIGQRHIGVNFKIPKEFAQESNRLYVVAKNISKNTITVGYRTKEEASNTAKKSIVLTDVSFVTKKQNVKNREVLARTRYRQKLQPAQLIKERTKWMLEFSKPQEFVAPGQSAVLYTAKGKMIGGGIIAT